MAFGRHVQRDPGSYLLLQLIERGLTIGVMDFNLCLLGPSSRATGGHPLKLPDGQFST